MVDFSRSSSFGRHRNKSRISGRAILTATRFLCRPSLGKRVFLFRETSVVPSSGTIATVRTKPVGVQSKNALGLYGAGRSLSPLHVTHGAGGFVTELENAMRITESLLEQGKSDRGGWNAKQLAWIGVDWPVHHGWQRKALGKEITENDARMFLSLRGETIRQPARRSVIKTDLPIPSGYPVKAETVIASFWLFLSRMDRELLRKTIPVLEYITRKASSLSQEK